MIQTTLCYIEKNDCYLMLHRVKKQHDENAGKWIGVGGHLEKGESPESCVRREAFEETGLRLTELRSRGIVDFYSDVWQDERMFLYTADEYEGDLHECDEGVLRWVRKEELQNLNLWEGDRIFLNYLQQGIAFFHLELRYRGERLVSWKLHPRIILASQSPRRLELLNRIGIFPEVYPSGIAENAASEEPDEMVKELSWMKADDILKKELAYWKKNAEVQKGRATEKKGDAAESAAYGSDHRNVYILSADTVVALDRKVLGKPLSHAEAEQMIRLLQGRTHHVYTGVTVLKLRMRPEGTYELCADVTFSNETKVRVASMSDEEIQLYAESDEPMDKAGAYGIQGTFAAFVEGIEGDYNTVVGLPVRRVYKTLVRMEKSDDY